MNIHEYQAKQLLKGYGVDVLDGGIAHSKVDAFTVAERLGGPVWVVKSQIHAGGRGKGRFQEAAAGSGGGVRLARSPHEVKATAEQMLGHTLVTHQTGAEGRRVKRVYVE
ncbi:ATP-grasp domain-containing protein, partial [Oleispirillum naphthae]|uniref:ATP-grasp domain-containing protein n=1 Tax=Oleispirillum naphthae TaxID=2838853 RepID=UPI0030825F25